MNYLLTDEQLDDVRNQFLNINGEELVFIENTDEDEDDNGKYSTSIFQRESDSKFFAVDLFWDREWDDTYEYHKFEPNYNYDKWAYEVKKIEVISNEWESLEEDE